MGSISGAGNGQVYMPPTNTTNKVPSQTTQGYQPGQGRPDGGNNLYRGSSIIPESAFVDADVVTVTPDNIGELGGDVLLTPQQTKELYEKGSLQVRRELQTAESNEGFMSITAKLAAAIVGPSRSVAAIQIDPLFMEMIKDPNAKVGMGYTKVQKETWTVLPSATPTEQTPKPADKVPPMPVTPADPERQNGVELTEKHREVIDKQVQEKNETLMISTTRQWAGSGVDRSQGKGAYAANQTDSVIAASIAEYLGVGDEMIEGSPNDGTGRLIRHPDPKKDKAITEMMFRVQNQIFAGEDYGTYNVLDRFSEIAPRAGLAVKQNWSPGRQDGQYTTKNANSSVNQFSDKTPYQFFIGSFSGDGIKGPDRERYAQMAGINVEDIPENANMLDYRTLDSKTTKLSSPPSDMEAANVPEEYQKKSEQAQDAYIAFYKDVFPNTTLSDTQLKEAASNASVQDLYTLMALSAHGKTGSNASSIVETDAQGNISLKNTPEARNGLASMLNIPANKAAGLSADNMVTSYQILMESNFIPQAGMSLLFTSGDMQAVGEQMGVNFDENGVPVEDPENDANGQNKLLAAGMSMDQIRSIFSSQDRTADVENIQVSEQAIENHLRENRLDTSKNGNDWRIAEAYLVGQTIAGQTPPMDISSISNADIKNNLTELKGIVFKAGSDTEPQIQNQNFKQGRADELYGTLRNQINQMPEGEEKTNLLTELNRINDTDMAVRGQFRQKPDNSVGTVTPPSDTTAPPRKVPYFDLSDVTSIVEENVSAVEKLSSNAADPNYLIHPSTVDSKEPPGYKQLLQAQSKNLDDILSGKVEVNPALTSESREKLEALKARVDKQIEQIADPNSAISQGAKRGEEVITSNVLAAENGEERLTGIAGINRSIDSVEQHLESAKTTGLSPEERQNVTNILGGNEIALFQTLKTKGVPVSTPAEALNVSKETLVSSGIPEDEATQIIAAKDKINNARVQLNLLSEAQMAVQTQQSTGKLQEATKPETFEKLITAKAFTGELSRVASLGDGELFNAFMEHTYGLPSYNTASAEIKGHYDTLRKAAINETLPAAPSVEFVDASTLNGGNGAYVRDSVTGESTIRVSKDLLNDPEALKNVLTEEMFHHLEHNTEIQAIKKADGRDAETEGDEGHAGLKAMEAILKDVGISAEAVKTAALKGRDQVSSVTSGGRIEMDAVGSDHGRITGTNQTIEFNSTPAAPDTDFVNPNQKDEKEVIQRDPLNIPDRAGVDMPIQARNANPTQRADMTGVDAELFNAAPPTEGTTPPPEGEADGGFKMAQLLEATPGLLKAFGQTLFAKAQMLDELAEKFFKQGVANNLSNASSLMSHAQSLNGYFHARADLTQHKDAPNYSLRPEYGDQTPDNFAKERNQYYNDHNRQTVQRDQQNVQSAEARETRVNDDRRASSSRF